MIDEATKASGRSVRALAANAGMSDTRWRQVVKGVQPGPGGKLVEARASATSLARMAIAVGLSPEQLEQAGRDDAAEAQRRFAREMQDNSVVPLPVGSTVSGMDEIEMIYASRSLSARDKLVRIRMVLDLRRQAEEDQLRAQQNAPADEAGAQAEQQPG
jgi:hypothetical protein